MEHYFAVGQGADRLAVLADVGDHHDAGQQLRIALGKVFRWPRQLAELAEIAGRADQVLLRQLLAGKDDDEMIEPSIVDGADSVLVRLFAQIEAADFSPDMSTEGNDVEACSSIDSHGPLLRANRRHAPSAAIRLLQARRGAPPCRARLRHWPTRRGFSRPARARRPRSVPPPRDPARRPLHR